MSSLSMAPDEFNLMGGAGAVVQQRARQLRESSPERLRAAARLVKDAGLSASASSGSGRQGSSPKKKGNQKSRRKQ